MNRPVQVPARGGFGRALATSDLGPGVLAVATLAGTVFGLGVPLVAGLGLAAVAYLGSRWALPDADPEVVPGLRRGAYEAGLAALREKVGRLEYEGSRLAEGPVRAQVGAVLTGAHRLVEHVAADPADLPRARPVLELYLDTTTDVVGRYRKLALRPNPENAEALQRVEAEVLPHVRQGVEDLETQLQHDDVVDLEVAAEMLTYRTRNLG